MQQFHSHIFFPARLRCFPPPFLSSFCNHVSQCTESSFPPCPLTRKNFTTMKLSRTMLSLASLLFIDCQAFLITLNLFLTPLFSLLKLSNNPNHHNKLPSSLSPLLSSNSEQVNAFTIMFGFSLLARLLHALLSVVQAPNLSPPNSTHPPSSPSHDDIPTRSHHTLCDTILPHSQTALASIIRSMPMIPMLTNAFSVDYSPWRMERPHTSDSIILGGCNGELRVVSLHNRQETHTLRGHEHNAIAAICVGQSGRIVSCDSTGTVIFWTNENPTHWYHIPGTGRDEYVECMQLVSSHRAVVGTRSGILLLIDLSNGGILSAVRAHAETVRSLAVAADGSVVVSASADCCARVWNAHTLQPVGNTLVGHTKSLNDLAVSECGQRVASAGDDGSVCIWDLQTCTQVFAPLRGHHGPALSVAFSADGKLLYSGDSERICMWDVSRLDNEVIFIGELRDERMRNVCSLRMSADGSELIALASDVFVWRVCGWRGGGGGGEVARYEWMLA